MTTTAFDDQFTDAPEPVHQQYSTADILRRNVADLEIALKQQTERAENAEAELAKLREQKPVAWDCGGSITANSGYAEWFSRKDHGAAVPLYTSPVPAPAVPEDWREAAQQLIDAAVLKCWLIEKPATSEWPAIWLTITTDGRRWVSDGGTIYASGGDWYFTTAAVEALKFADKESADEYVRHNKIKDVVATEHIFEARALLQSASTGEPK